MGHWETHLAHGLFHSTTILDGHQSQTVKIVVAMSTKIKLHRNPIKNESSTSGLQHFVWSIPQALGKKRYLYVCSNKGNTWSKYVPKTREPKF